MNRKMVLSTNFYFISIFILIFLYLILRSDLTTDLHIQSAKKLNKNSPSGNIRNIQIILIKLQLCSLKAEKFNDIK